MAKPRVSVKELNGGRLAATCTCGWRRLVGDASNAESAFQEHARDNHPDGNLHLPGCEGQYDCASCGGSGNFGDSGECCPDCDGFGYRPCPGCY